MSRRAALRRAFVLLGLAAAPRGARAAEVPAPSAPPPAGLEVVVFGPARACEALGEALASLGEDDRVRWRCEPGPAPTTSDAALWVDATAPSEIRIWARAGGSPADARVVPADDLTPVASETVAQIVRSTAAALLAAEVPAPPPPPARPVMPAPPAAPVAAPPLHLRAALPAARPSPPGRFALEIAFGYETRAMFVTSQPLDSLEQGAAASLGVSMPFHGARAFMSLQLGLGYVSISGDDWYGLSLAVVRTSTRAMFGLAWQPSRFLTISDSTGVGVDAIKALPPVGETSTLLGNRLLMAWRSTLAVSVPIAGLRCEATAALSVDAVERSAIGIAGPYQPYSIIVSTRGVQPGATIGLGWRL